MKVQRENEIQEVSPEEAQRLQRRGWLPVTESAGEEIIRLKPPVKPKATAKALEEANKTIGDE
jgi:hypothetical protein